MHGFPWTAAASLTYLPPALPGMAPGLTKGDCRMHSTRLAFAFALAAALGPVVPAWAATYSSPLLTVPIGGQGQCRVSNVGTTSINVSVTLYDPNGGALAPTFDGCTALYAGVVPAGATCIITVGPSAPRCVVNASSSKVRVVVLTIDADANVTATEPATRK